MGLNGVWHEVSFNPMVQLLRYSYKHWPNTPTLVRFALNVVFSKDNGVFRRVSSEVRQELLTELTDSDSISAIRDKLSYSAVDYKYKN